MDFCGLFMLFVVGVGVLGAIGGIAWLVECYQQGKKEEELAAKDPVAYARLQLEKQRMQHEREKMEHERALMEEERKAARDARIGGAANVGLWLLKTWMR